MNDLAAAVIAGAVCGIWIAIMSIANSIKRIADTKEKGN